MAAVPGPNIFVVDDNISYEVIFSEEEANEFNQKSAKDKTYPEKFLKSRSKNITNSVIECSSENFANYKEKNIWTRENTLLLIETYRLNQNEFQKTTLTKTEAWKIVSAKMKESNVMVEWFACQKKWNNVMATYRKLADNNKSTGRGRISWPFFNIIDEMMSKTGSMLLVSQLGNNESAKSIPSTTNVNSETQNSQTKPREEFNINLSLEESAFSESSNGSSSSCLNKRKRKIPSWAQELLENHRKKAKDTRHQETIENLLREHIEEQKRRTDAILELAKALKN